MAKTLPQAIAAHTRQPVARDVAVAMDEGAIPDALSSGLCTDAFFLKHFGKKTPVSTAKDAVRNGLTDVQLEHFLATEKRASVLTVWVQDQHPTWDTLCRPDLTRLLQIESIDKVLARDAGVGVLHADELAARPADAFGPGLRAWRLTSALVDDAEVLAEVLAFDEWGQKFLPQALSFVIADRSHLLPVIVDQLPPDKGESLRTQIAGSHRFGVLDADQQCAVLLVDELAARRLSDTDDRVRFACMAAQGNPFTRMETLCRLATATDNEFLTRNRDRYQPYDLHSLDDVTDADRMARIVRWVAPSGERKGKPAIVPELVKHPLLEITDAETLVRDIGGVDYITWIAPRITQAWRDLEGRFPESEFLADTASDTLRGTVRKGYWMFEDRTAADLPSEQDSACRAQAVPDIAAAYSVKTLHEPYGAMVGVPYLDQHFGDDQDAWKTFFATAPAVPDLTLEDVASLCAAVRA